MASAEDEAAVNDAAQANNPLLRAKAFNVHDYYIGDLTDIDEDANQFWMRFAMPFSIGDTKWLMRASLLTVNTVRRRRNSSRKPAWATSTCLPRTK